jgi:hypothetical protein
MELRHLRSFVTALPKTELCMAWGRRDTSEVVGALRTILQRTFRKQSTLFTGLRS